MNRKQKIIVSVVGIFIVLLALVGITYGYFLTTITDNSAERSIEIATANLELVYNDGTPEIDLSGITPLYTSEVQSKGLVKTFTISKTTASDNVYAKIKLINLSVPTAVATYDLKWALYKGTTPVATGDFGGKTSGEIVMATNQLINSTTGSTYNLYIWINETGLDQSNMMNQTITAKIDVIGYGKPEETLASKILGVNNANVLSDTPTFTTSSQDESLFVQQGDVTKSEMGFPTYYFRGSILGNYVSFGNSCSGGTCTSTPIIWRIVRINEDGSIRLILDETNPTGVNYSAVLGNVTFNNALTAANNFYNSYSTMGVNSGGYDSSLDDKVVISSFCNDHVNSYETMDSMDFGRFGSSANATPNPMFVCSNGATKTYGKVGMITADEVIYAGNILFQSTTMSSYLNSVNRSWTSTTANGSISLDVNTNALTFNITSNGLYVRPVINLSPDVIVSSGDGWSVDTAYVIE